MKFEFDDIITIDEEDYYVAGQTKKDNKDYIFLIKTNEEEELLEEFDIVLLNDDNTLSEIEEDDVYASLYEEFIGKIEDLSKI